jgi:hypothetical protein
VGKGFRVPLPAVVDAPSPGRGLQGKRTRGMASNGSYIRIGLRFASCLLGRERTSSKTGFSPSSTHEPSGQVNLFKSGSLVDLERKAGYITAIVAGFRDKHYKEETLLGA